jgi:hypothetical protein
VNAVIIINKDAKAGRDFWLVILVCLMHPSELGVSGIMTQVIREGNPLKRFDIDLKHR